MAALRKDFLALSAVLVAGKTSNATSAFPGCLKKTSWKLEWGFISGLLVK